MATLLEFKFFVRQGAFRRVPEHHGSYEVTEDFSVTAVHDGAQVQIMGFRDQHGWPGKYVEARKGLNIFRRIVEIPMSEIGSIRIEKVGQRNILSLPNKN